jgi:cell division protein FtsI/penicillin-binding protein 2
LYVDAMPASTVKPVMALAFLLDNPAYRSGQPLKDLWHDLKTSNSEDFLDRLFCGDGVSGQKWRWQDCHRPQKAQEAANALGWNLGCAAAGSTDCARLDVLFGRPSGRWLADGTRPLGLDLLYGRLFTETPEPEKTGNLPVDGWAMEDSDDDSRGFRLIQDFRFAESFAKACSQGDFCPECAGHKRWRRCRGVGGKLANEGWGQGEARVIPLAVAGMVSRLAAAANGAKAQAYPHLIDHVGDAQGQPLALAVERYAAPEPIAIDQGLAGLVLQGMASHQTGGTAADACKNAFGAAAVCDRIDWIAGKTGTPPFRFDGDTLTEIRKLCYANDGKPKIGCNLMPYKWYVAAFKTGAAADAPYDKAIAVLSERNWRKKNGLVQAPGDREVNLSAEMALRIIKALRTPVAVQADPAKHKAKPWN